MTAFDSLIHALLASFAQHKHELHGKRIWLACSGGRDSLSLAMMCRQLFDSGQLPFLPQLLHVNHGIQESNTAWAQQVMDWARQQQMPCQVLTVNLTDKSEQSARRARYDALIKEMNSEDVLLLGHHQDDQVETVLMRLFSGAGVTGLGGMQTWRYKKSTLPSTEQASPKTSPLEPQKGIYLWRPWLSVSRAQITAYATSQQLAYIDDPTNIITTSMLNTKTYNNSLSNNVISETAIVNDSANNYESVNNNDSVSLNDQFNINDRAWLRSVLIPRILERYPQAGQSIARSSQLMQDASNIIAERVAADLHEVCITDHYWHSVIDINELLALSHARQSALIHTWLAPNSSELPPSKRLVDEVLELSRRSDNDHQTCLYWDTALCQYEIRRYQNKLYRMHVKWVKWLNTQTTTQRIKLSIDKADKVPDIINLKPEASDFYWSLSGFNKLVATLIEHLHAIHSKIELTSTSLDNITTQSNHLVFETLPRDLKVTLAGREGRKSGKKLLQALHQPSFMRQSVVLCSLYHSSNQAPIPLFLITTDSIISVDGPFLKEIDSLINKQILLNRIKEL